MTQSLTILGSTGSIGTSTLDVVARHPERFRIFALSGHSQTAKLAEQCLAFRPQYAVTANEAQAAELRTHLAAAGCQTEVLHGEQALCDIAAAPEKPSTWPTKKRWWFQVASSCKPPPNPTPASCRWTANTTPSTKCCRRKKAT